MVLFYAEENRRGRRAWEQCKRSLKSQGIALYWTNYIPAEVPEDENIFGVPEMATWFNGRTGIGWSDFTHALASPTYAGFNINSNTARVRVAEIRIALPGTTTADSSTVFLWDDPASRVKAARMINEALGPTARAPQSLIGIGLMLHKPDDVEPAQLVLRCQSAPTEKELKEFFTDSIVHANAGLADRVLRFESNGDGSYSVTVPRLATATDYLAWSDGLEPQFAVIQRALQRPCSRLDGFYANPKTVPQLDFRFLRNLAQTLGARAQSHLLLGQPEEALSDLTLIHAFCRRIPGQQKPATLLSAMINQAVRGLYAAQIGEGFRLQAWREPQLIALQQQLKDIDVISPVKEAFTLEAVITHRALESVPSAGMVKRTFLTGLCPSGWGYRHVAARLNLDFGRLSSLDAANQIILADKVAAAAKEARSQDRGLYTFSASLEQTAFERACQNTAHSQTEINQALVACALERFRLAHGDYPENLDALVPQFLDTIPHDVIGGRPLHYHRAPEGAFVLYSVGWNGRDDGGVRGQPLPAADGDWVWPD